MKSKPNYLKLILAELREIKSLMKPEVSGREVPEESEPSFQALLDATKRAQYTNKEVVSSVVPCQPQAIEFFTISKYLTDDELEKAYRERGLIPAHPYALALFSQEHEDSMDEKKYVATHWKDASSKWCYAAFSRWFDERHVYVYRSDDDWSVSWLFAGVRK